MIGAAKRLLSFAPAGPKSAREFVAKRAASHVIRRRICAAQTGDGQSTVGVSTNVRSWATRKVAANQKHWPATCTQGVLTMKSNGLAGYRSEVSIPRERHRIIRCRRIVKKRHARQFQRWDRQSVARTAAIQRKPECAHIDRRRSYCQSCRGQCRMPSTTHPFRTGPPSCASSARRARPRGPAGIPESNIFRVAKLKPLRVCD